MAGELEDFRNASKSLQAGIEKTKCGYCKMIMGDSKEIIDRYLKIVDDLAELDKISSGEKEFLSATQSKVDEVLRPEPPPIVMDRKREMPTLNPFGLIRDMRKQLSPFGGNGILSGFRSGNGILSNGPLRQRFNKK